MEGNIVEKEIKDSRHIYQKKRVIVPCVMALILLFLGTLVSINSIYYKSTDDAFVEGHIITVSHVFPVL